MVTLNVYVVFAASPPNDVVVPVPLIELPPGLAVTVQSPKLGRPLRATLPVLILHVGWVIVPTTGAVGMPTIVTDVVVDTGRQPPDAGVVYVTVYVPAVLVLGVIEPVEEFRVSEAEALNVPPV